MATYVRQTSRDSSGRIQKGGLERVGFRERASGGGYERVAGGPSSTEPGGLAKERVAAERAAQTETQKLEQERAAKVATAQEEVPGIVTRGLTESAERVGLQRTYEYDATTRMLTITDRSRPQGPQLPPAPQGEIQPAQRANPFRNPFRAAREKQEELAGRAQVAELGPRRTTLQAGAIAAATAEGAANVLNIANPRPSQNTLVIAARDLARAAVASRGNPFRFVDTIGQGIRENPQRFVGTAIGEAATGAGAARALARLDTTPVSVVETQRGSTLTAETPQGLTIDESRARARIAGGAAEYDVEIRTRGQNRPDFDGATTRQEYVDITITQPKKAPITAAARTVERFNPTEAGGAIGAGDVTIAIERPSGRARARTGRVESVIEAPRDLFTESGETLPDALTDASRRTSLGRAFPLERVGAAEDLPIGAPTPRRELTSNELVRAFGLDEPPRQTNAERYLGRLEPVSVQTGTSLKTAEFEAPLRVNIETGAVKVTPDRFPVIKYKPGEQLSPFLDREAFTPPDTARGFVAGARPGIAYVREGVSDRTIFHEQGHNLQALYGELGDPSRIDAYFSNPTTRAEYVRASRKGLVRPIESIESSYDPSALGSEMFAESYAAFRTSPADFRSKAPSIARYLEERTPETTLAVDVVTPPVRQTVTETRSIGLQGAATIRSQRRALDLTGTETRIKPGVVEVEITGRPTSGVRVDDYLRSLTETRRQTPPPAPSEPVSTITKTTTIRPSAPLGDITAAVEAVRLVDTQARAETSTARGSSAPVLVTAQRPQERTQTAPLRQRAPSTPTSIRLALVPPAQQQRPRTTAAPRLRPFTDARTNTRNLPRQTPAIDVGTALESATIQTPDTQIRTEAIPRQTPDTRIRTEAIPRQTPEGFARTTITSVIPKTFPIIIPKPAPRATSTPTFDVEVRRGGVFRKVNPQPVSLQQATRLGLKTVRETAAASYRVTRKGKAINTGLPLAADVSASTREAGVVIQKAPRRISSGGEKREITFKGIKKVRAQGLARAFGGNR